MLPIHIIHQIAQALAAKYPESATDYFRMSEAISLVTDGADFIAAREGVPSDVAYEDAFDDWYDAVRYDETVWYEPIVQIMRINSIYGQPSAYKGETEKTPVYPLANPEQKEKNRTETTPVYLDTDSSCIYPLANPEQKEKIRTEE